MAAKKEEHAKAFEKGVDEEKLESISTQYQEQSGQANTPHAGPDPIIEAIEKQNAAADNEPIRDQAQVAEDLEAEEKEAEDKT